MLTCQRQLFDLGEQHTYLNAAYMGPLPRAARQAGQAAAALKTQPWNVSGAHFFEPVERVRELYAKILGGNSDCVALVPSVSYGLAVAAKNVPIPTGSTVLVLADQFPSNIYAWREAAARNGASLRSVQRREGLGLSDGVLEAIDEQTSVVAVPHCHWMDGARLDLVQVGRKVREVGAALVIDGCQSVGAMPLDVQAVQPDFVAGASYKWLLGPYSSGFLWAHPKYHEGQPIEFNWINRAHSEDFAGLINYQDNYQPGARRFDMGEVSNFGLLPQVEASLTLMNTWRPDRIAAYTQALTDQICDGAEALGLGVLPRSERSPHLVGLRLKTQDPKQVAAQLAEAQVHVSVRGDSIRVSAHVFNDASDVQRLLQVLSQAVAL